jgi:hypothetical protein
MQFETEQTRSFVNTGSDALVPAQQSLGAEAALGDA